MGRMGDGAAGGAHGLSLCCSTKISWGLLPTVQGGYTRRESWGSGYKVQGGKVGVDGKGLGVELGADAFSYEGWV